MVGARRRVELRPGGAAPGAGADDGGLAFLARDAQRGPDFPLTQTFPLAGKDYPGGLRMRLDTGAACGGGGCTFESLSGFSVRLNDEALWFPSATLAYSDLKTQSACLGAGSRGPQTTMTVRGPTLTSWVGTVPLALDSVTFAPDDTCPSAGPVENGDFSLPLSARWTLVGAGAGRVTHGQLDGSPALRLERSTLCSSVSAATSLWIPLATELPHPAVRFTYLSPLSAQSLSLDGQALQLLPASQPTAVTLCLTKAQRGRVVSLKVDGPPSLSGACNEPDGRWIEVDDLAVTSEQACAGVEDGPEGTFEGGFVPRGWLPTAWCTFASSCGDSAVGVDATGGRTGAAALRISRASRCEDTVVNAELRVPEASALGGPALKFAYRLPSLNSGAQLSLTLDQWGVVLAPTSSWSVEVVCLPRASAGTPVPLTFRLRGTGGLCGERYPVPDVAWVDDVQVTTDSACP